MYHGVVNAPEVLKLGILRLPVAHDLAPQNGDTRSLSVLRTSYASFTFKYLTLPRHVSYVLEMSSALIKLSLVSVTLDIVLIWIVLYSVPSPSGRKSHDLDLNNLAACYSTL